MTKPYRPCNGSEGEWFQNLFCDRCEHDRAYREREESGCEIIARTMAFRITDPEYPKEWVEDDDGSNPRCIVFEPEQQS